MQRPFLLFFGIAVAYHLITCALVFLVQDNPMEAIQSTQGAILGLLSILYGKSLIGLLAAGATLILGFYLLAKSIRAEAIFAMFGLVIFFPTFSLAKTTMPHILPFYADPYFAQFDRWLHFGVDPWVIVLKWLPQFPAELGSRLYLHTWLTFALSAPILIAFFDTNPKRRFNFVLLYVFCWIGLGNFVALAGLSVGPVFYDRFFADAQFADFTAFFAASELAKTEVFQAQEFLWKSYESENQSVGRGISAFPSVHVGMATVLALYLWWVHKILGVFGFAFLGFVLYFSVASGFHYAIDGYASIILVYLVALLLKRVHSEPSLTF